MRDELDAPIAYIKPSSFFLKPGQEIERAVTIGTPESWCLLSDFYPLDVTATSPTLRPQFVRMYNYLSSVAPAGSLAGRQHIDPLDFPDLLTFINLVDVEYGEEAPQFRFRLVGTTQTIMAKRDISGLYVEDAVLPSFAERIISNLRRVVASSSPLYDRFSMPHPNREFIDSERVYFPLAGDGKQIDMILILNGYYGVSGLDPFDKRK